MVLTQERKDKGLSLKQISQKINMSIQVLHAIERGRSGLNVKRAKAIAALFDKPIDYFFEPTYYKIRK
ncbi:helix-turn-helix domain-containing protein [Bacillus cereus]|uniref:XRE family transcriptional regulator n=1 Tax=Bacillus cereus TaxID=1396 RepID=A0A9X7M0N9_BACCE|nr:helix-turn-helix transcriptional regulator [Bacillus cereus]QDZ76574.1 XRE family transcriptional regulator [Bacillus cereus]